MRIVNTFSGRPNYYDRGPTQVGISYGPANAIAPHGSTQRATYTVPTGRKAMVEAINVNIFRDVVATTAGLALAQSTVPGGGSLDALNVNGNVVGNGAQKLAGVQMLLNAADNTKIFTQDASTGGSHAYSVTATIAEFDA
jgi:hypothetical protein